MNEEIYELQQNYLVPDPQRQQNLIEEAIHTDNAINNIINANVKDVVHSLVHLHPNLAKTMFEELSYWVAKDSL